MKKYLLIVLFAVVIAGPWQTEADEQNVQSVERYDFSFSLPERWAMPKDQQQKGRRKAQEKILVATKDGVELEKIEFRQRLISTSLEHTKKTIAPGMRPQEMAEIIQNDFELNTDMKNFIVHENKPASVGGIPAFRLVFSYRDEGTLRYKCVYYGFQKKDMFYSVQFVAPLRHYFDTYLPTFEQVVTSVKVPD